MNTEMLLCIRYHAVSKELAGCDREQLPYIAGERVAGFKRRLGQHRPALATLLATARIARNDDFAGDDEQIESGDTLHVLPPVSGGAGGSTPRDEAKASIVNHPIEPGQASRRLCQDGAGAVATFTGVVRPRTGERRVLHLDYEAHVALATTELARILDEASERFVLSDAHAIHRIGRVEIGQVAVDIAVCAPHRAEALDGCRYVIEELKKRVPIWKRETDEKGSVWVTPMP